MPVLLIKVFPGGQLGIQQELLWNIIVINCFGEYPPKIHSDRTQRVRRFSYSAGFSCSPGPDTKPLLHADRLGAFSRLDCFAHSGSHRERLDLIWTQVHSQV